MRIQVNGAERELAAESSLRDLLNSLSLPHDRVAIEVNGAVIRRAEWALAILNEGDRVEIVHFVGGGGLQ